MTIAYINLLEDILLLYHQFFEWGGRVVGMPVCKATGTYCKSVTQLEMLKMHEQEKGVWKIALKCKTWWAFLKSVDSTWPSLQTFIDTYSCKSTSAKFSHHHKTMFFWFTLLIFAHFEHIPLSSRDGDQDPDADSESKWYLKKLYKLYK